MRARNIKPGFFCNEELVELSPLCRLFFIGLWCFADREGYFEDRPLKIKMAVFPAEGHDVKAMLADLCHAGFLSVFCLGGFNIYRINNFAKHQRPHQNEPVSTLAPMVEGLAPMVEATCANGTSTWTGMRNEECGKLNVEGGMRNDENPTSPGPQAEPAGGDAPQPSLFTGTPPATEKPKRPQAEPADPWCWDEFASVYPEFRLKPDKAAKAWLRKNAPDTQAGRATFAKIKANIVGWLKSEQWIQGKVPNCSKYLDENIWQGTPGPPPYRSVNERKDNNREAMEGAKRILGFDKEVRNDKF